jgi:selenocysteine lyase/cysteine desulfurase
MSHLEQFAGQPQLNIACYEHDLSSIPGVRLIGTAADKASVASFVLAGYSTEEVGRALNEEGIAATTTRTHFCIAGKELQLLISTMFLLKIRAGEIANHLLIE